MGFPQQTGVEKTVHEAETHRLSGKEKAFGAAISKEGKVDSLLRHN